jgi:hypothetical protein
MKKTITHSLNSAELDAIEAHLRFLAAAADQDERPSHAGGLQAALTYLATARRESYARRVRRAEDSLTTSGFPR